MVKKQIITTENFINIKKESLLNLDVANKLTGNQKALLGGSFLGDGFFELNNNTKIARMSITHSIGQADYIAFKFKSLKNVISSTHKLYHYHTKGGYETLHFKTLSNNVIYAYIHKFFNEEGNKQIDEKVFEIIKEPEAVAIWFMDNGTFSGRKKSIEFKLNTHNFTKEELQILQQGFKQFYNIECNIYIEKYSKVDNRPYYILRFGPQEGPKLLEIIKAYIHPSMEYKLGLGGKDILTQRKLEFDIDTFLKNNKDIKEVLEYQSLNLNKDSTIDKTLHKLAFEEEK